MKIACVQQNHNAGKVRENREKAIGFAKEALGNGAEIVLFHEELLIGYHKDMKELAEPADGITTSAFAELLAGMEAKIVYGLTAAKNSLAVATSCADCRLNINVPAYAKRRAFT